MKNTYYIDETKKNRTLTVLGTIHGVTRHIESVLEAEIQKTKQILKNIKEKKDAT